VRRDDRFRDRHAKTRAVRFPVRNKRFEKSGQQFRWNSHAGIGDTDHDLAVHQVGADAEDASVWHRLARVLDQIGQDPNETRKINKNVPVVSDIFCELNIVTRKQPQRLLIQFIEQAPDRDHFARERG
jgi:hypothetical protein